MAIDASRLDLKIYDEQLQKFVDTIENVSNPYATVEEFLENQRTWLQNHYGADHEKYMIGECSVDGHEEATNTRIIEL